MLEEEDPQKYQLHSSLFASSHSSTSPHSDSLLDEDGRFSPPDNWRAIRMHISGLGIAVVVVVFLVSGILFLEMRRRENSLPPTPAELRKWQTRLISIPTPESFESAFASYTQTEHRAGTDAGRRMATATMEAFEKAGLSAEMYSYSVLLSYPRFISAKMTFPVQCVPSYFHT